MNLFNTSCGVIKSDLTFTARPPQGFYYDPIDTFVGSITLKEPGGFYYSLDGLSVISYEDNVYFDPTEVGDTSYLWDIYGPICDSSYLFWLYYKENLNVLKRVPYNKNGFNTEAILSVEIPNSSRASVRMFIINNNIYLFYSKTLCIYDKNTLSLLFSTAISLYPSWYFNNKFYCKKFKSNLNVLEILESSDGINWNSSPVYTLNGVRWVYEYDFFIKYSCILDNNLFIFIQYSGLPSETKVDLLKFNGTSWTSLATSINSTFSTELGHITCINSNNNVLVLGTNTNVYGYSLDLGNTWNRVVINDPSVNFEVIAKMFPYQDFWTDFKDTTEYL